MSAPIALPATPALQPEFEPVIHDALDRLRATSGMLLHSVYMYGSVSRGTAVPGISDVDLTLVLTRTPTAQESESLERIRRELESRHTIVSKVDFDVGILDDVRNPAHQLSWGYWLKHECRCIHGPDLSLGFPPFHASRALAQALNGDYVTILGDYAKRISNASDAPTLRKLQKEAAKKLIRATHVFRPVVGDFWPRTLEEHVAYFCHRHPNMVEPMTFFDSHAKAPEASAREFNDRLDHFLAWMQQTQPVD